MGTTKHSIHLEQNVVIANYAKALAHPARIAIIKYLASQKTCVCGEIVNEIGLAQSTISQHLKALKEIGIVQGNISGTSVCYCLDYGVLESVKEAILNLVSLSAEETCC